MDPDPYLVLQDPDAGGPKTYGSGSATLVVATMFKNTYKTSQSLLVPEKRPFFFRALMFLFTSCMCDYLLQKVFGLTN